MSDFRREVDWISRAIAIIEIVGGATGAGIVGWGLLHGVSFLALLFLAAYVWCAYAGVQLWRQRSSGWRHSIFVQVLQIPWILTPHLTYRFAAGCGAWFGFGSSGLVKAHAIASRFDFVWASGFGPQFDNAPWHVAINIVAVASAGYLLWFRAKTAESRGFSLVDGPSSCAKSGA